MALLAIFVAIAIILMVAAFIIKHPAMFFGAAAGWLLFGIACYQMSIADWDIYYGAFFISMGLLMVCVLGAIGVQFEKNNQKKRDALAITINSNTDNYINRSAAFRERLDQTHNLTPSAARRRKKLKDRNKASNLINGL